MRDLSTVHDKRGRRTKARIEQLDQQILNVLTDDHPQSVRHVFYRMTDPRLAEPVEKSDHGYRQVQYRITELRRAGLLPYGWITDATRRGYHVDTFRDSADFLRRVTGLYRADIWRDADAYVEIWCESRSIAGVIEDDCEELAVSLYPAGGFSSITLAYQAAEYINEATAYRYEGSVLHKPAVILYVGDYDPAGVLIDVSLQKELQKHLHPDVILNFKRLAITEGQIIQYDLPTKPRKATDRRSPHVAETVEAEAMPARVLRQIVRGWVETFMPDGALQAAKAAEESERAGLLRLAEALEVAA
jgi:hypothetical protein